MAQARTRDKNLAGGLLVPLEVIDSRALIIERSWSPSFKPVRNVIDSASIGTKWAKVTMPNQSRVIRFGIFEVDLQAGEVRKAGLRQKLAGQPFQVLQVLLERPQDIVTRQELREHIWPGNTFVDYELALKKAVNRLREVLGDSAESPHFIETIPRRGYRFIGTISPQSIPPESREPRSTAANDSLKRPAVQTSARLSWRLIAAFSLAAIAALLLSLNADRLRTRIFARSRTPKIHSVAVLPLQNLSNDPDQEYFSDGMTDELITDLAKVSQLQVISHTSVERYKGTKLLLPEVARQLGVDAVVEGRVMRSGDRVRITVQLIDARTDRHLWAESYERDVRDVLALQDELAAQITNQVGISLSANEDARNQSNRPVDPAVEEAYLKGRYFWNKRTAAEVRKGIVYFERAIELDPNYAPAYAMLAESHVVLNGYRLQPPSQAYPEVRAAALKALQLDETLAAAHTALGAFTWEYEWDAAAGEREYRRAIALNPNDATAHQWYAERLASAGREQEALEQIRLAKQVDPLSIAVGTITGWILYLGRHYDQAMEEYRRTIEIDPAFPLAHTYLGRAYIQKGDFKAGLVECQTAARLSENSENHLFYVAWLAYAYAKAGKRDEALRMVRKLQATSRQSYMASHDVAAIFAGLGDQSEAFVWLNKARDERSYTALDVGAEPEFDPLRSDTRFLFFLETLR